MQNSSFIWTNFKMFELFNLIKWKMATEAQQFTVIVAKTAWVLAEDAIVCTAVYDLIVTSKL